MHFKDKEYFISEDLFSYLHTRLFGANGFKNQVTVMPLRKNKVSVQRAINSLNSSTLIPV